MRAIAFFLIIFFTNTAHSQEFQFEKFLNLDVHYKDSKIEHLDTVSESILGVHLKKISFKNEEFSDFTFLRGVDQENMINIKAFTCNYDSVLFIYKKGQFDNGLRTESQLIYLTVYDTIHEALMFLRIKNNNVISFTRFRKGVGDHWSSNLYFKLKNESNLNKTCVNYFINSIKDWSTISKLEPFDLFHSEVGPSVTTEYVNFLIWMY
jgi:hypothetical protein